VKRSWDIDNNTTILFHVSSKSSLRHVKGSYSINFNDSLKSFGAQFFSGGQEVSSGAIYKNIQASKLFNNFGNARLAWFWLSDITRDTNTSTELAKILGHSIVLLLVATEKDDGFSSVLQVGLPDLLEHTSVTSTSNQANFVSHKLRMVHLSRIKIAILDISVSLANHDGIFFCVCEYF